MSVSRVVSSAAPSRSSSPASISPRATAWISSLRWQNARRMASSVESSAPKRVARYSAVAMHSTGWPSARAANDRQSTPAR